MPSVADGWLADGLDMPTGVDWEPEEAAVDVFAAAAWVVTALA